MMARVGIRTNLLFCEACPVVGADANNGHFLVVTALNKTTFQLAQKPPAVNL